MPCEREDVKLYTFEHNGGSRKIRVGEKAGNYKEDHKNYVQFILKAWTNFPTKNMHDLLRF